MALQESDAIAPKFTCEQRLHAQENGLTISDRVFLWSRWWVFLPFPPLLHIFLMYIVAFAVFIYFVG